MRLGFLTLPIVLSVLGGCSSGSSGSDLQGCTPGATQVCVCPGGIAGAQTCGDDGHGFGACACPDAGSDAAIDDGVETSSDANADGGTDVAADVVTDAQISDPAQQQAWCEAGRTRLVWSPTAGVCEDTKLTTPCAFERTVAGVRCVPSASTLHIVGFSTIACSPDAFPFFTDETAGATYAMTVRGADGSPTVYALMFTAPPADGAWYAAGDASPCEVQSMPFPYRSPSGHTLSGTGAIDLETLCEAGSLCS